MQVVLEEEREEEIGAVLDACVRCCESEAEGGSSDVKGEWLPVTHTHTHTPVNSDCKRTEAGMAMCRNAGRARWW